MGGYGACLTEASEEEVRAALRWAEQKGWFVHTHSSALEEETEQRQREAFAADLAVRAAVARAQLEQVNEVIVGGCPQPECNGSYTPRPAHEGWPRFENEHGWHLYPWAGQPTRGQSQWFINDRFAPDVDEALAFIESADGSLPVGQHHWGLTQPDDKTVEDCRHSVTVLLK